MSPAVTAIVFLACLVSSFLIGMRLRQCLPENHFNEESKEAIELSIGLVAAMTALVLGLLTASTKSTYDDNQAAIRNITGNLLELDRLLVRYGDDAAPIRLSMRDAVNQQINVIWNQRDSQTLKKKLTDTKPVAEVFETTIRSLNPQTADQKAYAERALAILQDITKIRWQALAGAEISIPCAFLIMLALWLSLLFGSFGLFSPRNGTVQSILLLSALSVAAAIFVILEMGDPFFGVIKISSQPMEDFVTHLPAPDEDASPQASTSAQR